MKPYGVPRHLDVEYPDKDSIRTYGLAAPDRCGRKDRGKVAARRYWKKAERLAQSNELLHILNQGNT